MAEPIESDGKAGSLCRGCGAVLGYGRSRGLCPTCYDQHRRAGTLDEVALPVSASWRKRRPWEPSTRRP